MFFYINSIVTFSDFRMYTISPKFCGRHSGLAPNTEKCCNKPWMGYPNVSFITRKRNSIIYNNKNLICPLLQHFEYILA